MTGGYLIDTDWVIHHLNGHSEITKRLDELKTQDLGISLRSRWPNSMTASMSRAIQREAN